MHRARTNDLGSEMSQDVRPAVVAAIFISSIKVKNPLYNMVQCLSKIGTAAERRRVPKPERPVQNFF